MFCSGIYHQGKKGKHEGANLLLLELSFCDYEKSLQIQNHILLTFYEGIFMF